MSIDPKELETLNRDELINRARQLGAHRPELLTRPELRDEIIRLSEGDEAERRRARGWFGVARDLVASVVGQGLNLPDTAELIRGVHVLNPKTSPPVATVTLAEIYAAQGHVRKALDLLDEVLSNEPDHEAARVARLRLSKEVSSSQRAVIAQATADSSATDLGGTPDAEPTTACEQMPVSDSTEAWLGQVAEEPSPDYSSLPSMLGANDASEPEGESSTSVGLAENETPGSTTTALIENETPASRSATPQVNETLPSPAAEQAAAGYSNAALEAGHEPRDVVDVPRAEPVALGDSEPQAEAEPAQATLPEQQTVVASSPAACNVEFARTAADESPQNVTLPGTMEPNLQNNLVIVRLGTGEVYCAWQITEELLTSAQKARPSGVLVLRVIEVVTSWDGPETHESTWELSELGGHRRIEPQGSHSQLRAALGWLDLERFTVLVIGSEFAWDSASGSHLLWAPPAHRKADELQRSTALTVDRLVQAVRAA